MWVGISAPRQAALKAAGLPIPQFVQGTFLVDTGASCTCLDVSFVAPLGLVSTGNVPMQTPSTGATPVFCSQYDVAVFIPESASGGGFHIGALPVIETNIASQGIEGLIGRDIIDRCVLVYNGSAGMFTLAY